MAIIDGMTGEKWVPKPFVDATKVYDYTGETPFEQMFMNLCIARGVIPGDTLGESQAYADLKAVEQSLAELSSVYVKLSLLKDISSDYNNTFDYYNIFLDNKKHNN